MQGKNIYSQKTGNKPVDQNRQPSSSINKSKGVPSQSSQKSKPPKQGATKVQEKSKGGFLQGCLGCLGVTVLLGIVVVVVFAILGDDNNSSEVNVASTGTIATSQQGINEQVSSLIANAVGAKTNNDEEKIIELQVNDHMGTEAKSDKIVVAKLHGNDNLSSNMIKGGMQLESIKIFKQLFQLKEVEEIDLIWQFPTTDKLGNSTLNTALKINLSRTTFSKINWDGFDKDNFAYVADSYWEHPSLRED
ncbi:hypothetical protein MKZ07_23270 [Paenibacillus sp. FSL P4-0338]|uniref:hypothetical protein n=1 Tax=Paenibacillus sp. FSL P4-0338 TaxID=2921635 RepID=UPI0030FAEAAC